MTWVWLKPKSRSRRTTLSFGAYIIHVFMPLLCKLYCVLLHLNVLVYCMELKEILQDYHKSSSTQCSLILKDQVTFLNTVIFYKPLQTRNHLIRCIQCSVFMPLLSKLCCVFLSLNVLSHRRSKNRIVTRFYKSIKNQALHSQIWKITYLNTLIFYKCLCCFCQNCNFALPRRRVALQWNF